MCKRCEIQKQETIEQLEKDIVLLANGTLPEGSEELPEDARDEFRLSYLAIKAALVIALKRDQSPAIVLGELGGVLLGVELEYAHQQHQMDQAIRNAAPFN